MNTEKTYDTYDETDGTEIFESESLKSVFDELNREDAAYADTYDPDKDSSEFIGYNNFYKNHPFGAEYRKMSDTEKCIVFEQLIEVIKRTKHLEHSREREEAYAKIFAALYAVIAGHLHKMCIKYVKSDMRNDMLQEAYQAILMHLFEYDATKGQPSTFFLPHAKWGFNEAMRHANGSSKHFNTRIRQVRQAISALESEGLPFGIEHISRRTGLNAVSVKHTLRLMQLEAASNVDDALSVSSQEDTPEVAAEVSEKKDTVAAAIARLPQFQQDVIKCYFIAEGKGDKKNSLAFVARTLGKSPDSVKKAFNKALRALREDLSDYYKSGSPNARNRDFAIEGAAIESIAVCNILEAELDLIDAADSNTN